MVSRIWSIHLQDFNVVLVNCYLDQDEVSPFPLIIFTFKFECLVSDASAETSDCFLLPSDQSTLVSIFKAKTYSSWRTDFLSCSIHSGCVFCLENPGHCHLKLSAEMCVNCSCPVVDLGWWCVLSGALCFNNYGFLYLPTVSLLCLVLCSLENIVSSLGLNCWL